MCNLPHLIQSIPHVFCFSEKICMIFLFLHLGYGFECMSMMMHGNNLIYCFFVICKMLLNEMHVELLLLFFIVLTHFIHIYRSLFIFCLIVSFFIILT